jgi:hypothetical protein
MYNKQAAEILLLYRLALVSAFYDKSLKICLITVPIPETLEHTMLTTLTILTKYYRINSYITKN